MSTGKRRASKEVATTTERCGGIAVCRMQIGSACLNYDVWIPQNGPTAATGSVPVSARSVLFEGLASGNASAIPAVITRSNSKLNKQVLGTCYCTFEVQSNFSESPHAATTTALMPVRGSDNARLNARCAIGSQRLSQRPPFPSGFSDRKHMERSETSRSQDAPSPLRPVFVIERGERRAFPYHIGQQRHQLYWAVAVANSTGAVKSESEPGLEIAHVDHSAVSTLILTQPRLSKISVLMRTRV
ncbi:uncharacterized protein B0T23DRAFT_406087 [Neurospora hispaniola]|uniref:Uncharacterized protein n=1 Tax=Neurospora hispaniola TaxID=588809 RepID=A0AAJ0I3B6_9PEZI|nr:hypothetical protein B0T23DRAFT_406087 [Neurospora hispaniola]